MNIWITKLRSKPMTCAGCRLPVDTGSPVIIGQWYNEKKRYRKYWHAKNKDGYCCWLEEGLLNLEKNPPVENRGRKKMVLSAEDREKRLQLMKQRGSVVQRLRRAAAVPMAHRDWNLIIRLGAQLERLKEEIAGVGGVPKGW